MKLKFYLLALISLSFYQLSAQYNLTISATCAETVGSGGYTEVGLTNGKPNYQKNGTAAACNDYTSQNACEPPKRYRVFWSGLRWEWVVDINFLDCEWFPPAGVCIPAFSGGTSPSTVLLATSTDAKICGNWTAEPGGCTPTISGCETILCANNTGVTITSPSETGIDYYLLKNGSETIVDGPIAGTGNGILFNTGGVFDTAIYNVCKVVLKPTALEFAVGDEKVTVPNNGSLDFISSTIEMWVRLDSNSGVNRTLISMRDGVGAGTTRWSIHLNINNNTIGMYNGTLFAAVNSQTLTAGQWYHVAIVLSSTNTEIFLDGLSQGFTGHSMTVGTTGKTLVIGNNGDVINGNEDFVGLIDDVRIWNVERSGIQIMAAKDLNLIGNENGLVALYDFEDGSGTILSDKTSNGHNGTLVNMDPSTDWVISRARDIIQTQEVKVLPELTGIHNITVCFGGSTVVNGTTYDANNLTGTEVFTVGANNCDSTVTVALNVLSAIDVTVVNTAPTLTANQTSATYQWLDCNNGYAVISGEIGVSYTATASGDYAVEITVGNCIDTSACENINTVGINENEFGSNISIYPNPTKGLFTVSLLGLENNASIIIYSVIGEEVINQQITSSKTAINLAAYDKGIYFVKITNGDHIITQRIVK